MTDPADPADPAGPAGPAGPAFDLDAYLARIGHRGPREPDAALLAAVHRAHAQAIAFENLDPLLGRPVQLDLAALQAKLVRGGRGGYCYEHNLLLRAALRALGFEVTGLAARVLLNAPADGERPRTHMLLRVDLDGERWIVDAGFGGLTLTAPLRLSRGDPQATPHGPFRLVPQQDGWCMQAEAGGDWRTLYAFDLQPQRLADYEMTSWYLCHHPQSQFRQVLIAARPTAEGRHALRGPEYSFHPLHGPSQHRRLTDAAELEALLAGPFGLRLQALPDLRARLAGIVAAPGA